MAQSISYEEKGLQIMLKQEQRDSGWGTLKTTGTMVLYDSNNQAIHRSFELSRLERNTDSEGDLSLILFNDPADVKGTILLTHSRVEPADDNQWIYLPVIHRSRRISSSNRSGKFLSSEFSFEDMGGYEIEDNTYEWIRDENCPGELSLTCHVVSATPINNNSGYTKRIIWLDQEEFRPQLVEYYNRNRVLEKRLTFSNYSIYAGRFWRPSHMLMTNLRSNRKTEMLWHDFQFNANISSRIFSPQAISR